MLQDFVDDLLAAGRSATTIRNALLPLRAIYRRAVQREHVASNPTLKLSLPAVRSSRDRVARADEAAALLAALPAADRGLWATALYAGLRMGELQALDWADIDLEHNLIHVRRSWDRQAGFIEPKSRAGKRRVPLTPTTARTAAGTAGIKQTREHVQLRRFVGETEAERVAGRVPFGIGNDAEPSPPAGAAGGLQQQDSFEQGRVVVV